MCGIAGLITLDGSKPSDSHLHTLREEIGFRGRDQNGIKTHKNVGLVHTRLSIIDLSESGIQPMEIEVDGKIYFIVFNGELYNYLELKQRFLGMDIKYNSSTDTEVMAHLLARFGPEILNECRGFFAFSFYDVENSKLYLGRDQFGKKPLYYRSENSQFVFSSTIQGIQRTTSNLNLNYKALGYYFIELSMPQPYTIWTEIKQVNRGSYLELCTETGQINEFQYHLFSAVPKNSLSYEENKANLKEELWKSIELRLNADVPVGFFLSGGVDSGLIVSLAAANKKISTFSVGYKNSEINELNEAKIVADRYKTDHNELWISPNIKEDIEEILSCFGEPFADASAIPSFYITKEMKKNATVALSGDGGDEHFGYKSYGFANEIDELIRGKSKTKLRLEIESSRVFSKISKRTTNKGKYKFAIDSNNWYQLLFRGMGFSKDENNLYSDKNGSLDLDSFTSNYMKKGINPYQQIGITDAVFYSSFGTRLLNDYLVKVDRTSMLSGLEVRSPFLDLDFSKFAMSVPNQFKFKDGHSKYILKDLATELIDKEILNRPKKGFGVPINDWLRTDLKSYRDKYLSKEMVDKYGILNYDVVEREIKNLDSNQNTIDYKVWTLLVFSIWCSKNL